MPQKAGTCPICGGHLYGFSPSKEMYPERHGKNTAECENCGAHSDFETRKILMTEDEYSDVNDLSNKWNTVAKHMRAEQ